MSMSPQEDERDPGAVERQDGRRPRWSRRTTIGASAAATAIGLVVLAVILMTRPGEPATARGSNASIGTEATVTEPGTPRVDYTIDLSTGVMTPLPDAIVVSVADFGRSSWSRYAASPDGSMLAYVGIGDDWNPQIFIAGIDGTGVRQLTHDSREAMSPAWSPDGTRVAYAGYGADCAARVPNLFVAEIANGRSTQVTDAVEGAWDAQFTPDGSSLLYTGGSQSFPVLLTVPVAGGKSTLLVGPGAGLTDAGNGSLSPDGSLLTFLGGGNPESFSGHCGPCRLVANADGTDQRVIPGWVSNPAGTWSPDGGRIVVSDDDGIMVVDIATGDASRVAEGRAAIWLDRQKLLVDVP
jgi:WD40 repeat protein